ncbi:MAG: hypothetical protein JNK72_08330 [Myxococcales bacterium]|nr:hypothetical protein [Myxococcales bacterium]
MSSNQKSWENITRPEYELFVRNLRSKGVTPPYGDSGLLRSSAGLLADLSFNEKERSLHIRLREVGKGETYASVLGGFDEQVKRIDR